MPDFDAMTWKEIANSLLRTTHVLFGGLGLIVFWIPVFAKKGGKVHLFTGRIYEWCGYFVAVSAMTAVAWTLIAPVHRYDIQLTGEELRDTLAGIRFAFALLGVLTVAFTASLRLGLLYVRTRKSPDPMGGREPQFWLTALLCAGIASGVFGAISLAFGGHIQNTILVILGVIFAGDALKQRKYLQNPKREKMAWWYKHMEHMLGCGIAFHTAFLVFGASRLFDMSPLGKYAFLPWILPSIIGTVATHFWVKKYKRKFGDITAGTPKQPSAIPDV